MSIIVDVNAREVLDSRGNPTVEVEVFLEDGTMVVSLFLPVRLPALMKPWNFGTATRIAILAKAL